MLCQICLWESVQCLLDVSFIGLLRKGHLTKNFLWSLMMSCITKNDRNELIVEAASNFHGYFLLPKARKFFFSNQTLTNIGIVVTGFIKAEVF